MRWLAALVGLLVAACETTPIASTADTITRGDLIRLPDEVLARRLFGAVGDDLFVGYRNRNRLGRSLHGDVLWFWTRPHHTMRPGVCVSEWLIVSLEADSVGLPSQRQTLRLRSINRNLVHIVVDRAMARRLSGFDEDELRRARARCAEADPRRDSIPSDSPWQLMKAFELIGALGEEARQGRALAPIDCTRFEFSGPPTSEAECLAALARLSEGSVHWTQDCAEAVVIGGPCIRVQTSDWFIYLVMRQDQQLERIIVQGMEDMSQVHWGAR